MKKFLISTCCGPPCGHLGVATTKSDTIGADAAQQPYIR